MKYILGWLTITSGNRDRFLAELDTYIAATRVEEMSPIRVVHHSFDNRTG